MKYQNVVEGIFVNRPNRFIATVNINGSVETVHVKNTGRCKELLVPGVKVYLEKSNNASRKTAYDLVTVIKNENQFVNIDSQVPNAVFTEFISQSDMFNKNAIIRREVTYKSSRFDIYVEDGNRKCFIEVKGVTLEKSGVALFPDAPTVRGTKHVYELIDAKNSGFESYIAFVIQMKGATSFTPNTVTDANFSKALKNAYESGVNILAYDCRVTQDSIEIDEKVKVIL